MPREIPAFAPGGHWPAGAAATARAAAATGALDAAGLRLLDRWYRHLAERRVAVPRIDDYASFRGIETVRRLRTALVHVAPDDLPPLRLALRSLEAARWQSIRAAAGSPPTQQTGPKPELSLPLGELPKSWRTSLKEMRTLRTTLDSGRLTIEDRTPPSAKVIRKLESTLRIFAGVCRTNGHPIELTKETFNLWREARLAPRIDRKGRQRAGNRHGTVASRCKELALFASWCDMDEDLLSEIRQRGRRHLNAGRGDQKRKEAWMLSNDVGIGDVWVMAEELLEAAAAAPPGSALRASLTFDAACLALSIVAPLRIGDLHRITFGEHLERTADGWSLSIRTDKTDRLYHRPRLWPEVTPFLDAVILLDAPGSDFWPCYQERVAAGAWLFSQDGGASEPDELWPTKVWERHVGIGAHIVRSMWHQMMFDSEDDDQYIALALCGQGHGRTAMDYIVRGNQARALRRGRAKMRAAREAA